MYTDTVTSEIVAALSFGAVLIISVSCGLELETLFSFTKRNQPCVSYDGLKRKRHNYFIFATLLSYVKQFDKLCWQCYQMSS